MNAPPMLTVYSGRECCGFLLNRGKLGWEAVTAADQKSLGIYPTPRAAVAALPDAGAQQ